MHGEEGAAELAKEMEKKFWSDLQERLDEIKQNPFLTIIKNLNYGGKVLRKATAEDFKLLR